MPIEAGKLDKRIRFEREAAGQDDHGGVTGGWETIGERWAQVSNGTGQERREAAQEAASAPGTFRVRLDTLTRSITAEDRLRYNPFGRLAADSPIWDISSVVPFGRDAIDITATRNT